MKRRYKSRETLLTEIVAKVKSGVGCKDDTIKVNAYSKGHISVDRRIPGYTVNTCYAAEYNDWTASDLKDICKSLTICITEVTK